MAITVEQFKTYFDRNFTFGPTLPDVRDQDVQKAIDEAATVFNPDLYDVEADRDLAELYLSAHFLQNDLDAAEGEGQAQLLQQSRSVGSVSESMAIPDWMLQSDYSFYTTTYYGQKFLTITKPYLDGAVFSVGGATLP
jgi:hypothetical protein